MGASFKVHVEVAYTPKKLPLRHLDETIDYSAIYALVKIVMQDAQPLLETVASTIVRKIFENFLLAEHVFVQIEKLNPPILEFMGEAGVTVEMKRAEWQYLTQW